MRMLAKEPAQRFQKPVEVAQALTPFIKGGARQSPAVTTSLPPGVASLPFGHATFPGTPIARRLYGRRS